MQLPPDGSWHCFSIITIDVCNSLPKKMQLPRKEVATPSRRRCNSLPKKLASSRGAHSSFCFWRGWRHHHDGPNRPEHRNPANKHRSHLIICIYIYIYMYLMHPFLGGLERAQHSRVGRHTGNLRTNILDVRGFDSNIIPNLISCP